MEGKGGLMGGRREVEGEGCMKCTVEEALYWHWITSVRITWIWSHSWLSHN